MALCPLLSLIPKSAVLAAPLRRGYLRPLRSFLANELGLSTIQSDKNEFRINLDVQHFKPDELKVKVADGYIVVDGKHEQTSDKHGYISRQFTRIYKIPNDVDEASLVSNLCSDGVLVLKAAKKSPPEPIGKEIPIVKTDEPSVKDKSSEKKEE